MKYLILIPDGAADEKIESLGGKTALEAAEIDCMNTLALKGVVGLVRTIPTGTSPGSDAANLSVMGYDPAKYLTGRSPLEAASIGIKMKDTDLAFRTNFITLRGDGAYDDLLITDHSAGDITTEEADALIRSVNEVFANDQIHFYTGVSYRHCLIVQNGSSAITTTPPHDALDQRAGNWFPRGDGAEMITALMRDSHQMLTEHPVNQKRVKDGLRPANSLWIWGQGKKPSLTSFQDKFGINGSVISAVDLIKGIGLCAGLTSIDVPGATGTLHTNYEGKADAAIKAFKDGSDFVYLHVEGPDECSHQGDLPGKLESLKRIDRRILAPVLAHLENSGDDFRVLIVPDHWTPVRIRTHTPDPVPFVLFDSRQAQAPDDGRRFSEASGAKGLYFDSGVALADHFFEKK